MLTSKKTIIADEDHSRIIRNFQIIEERQNITDILINPHYCSHVVTELSLTGPTVRSWGKWRGNREIRNRYRRIRRKQSTTSFRRGPRLMGRLKAENRQRRTSCSMLGRNKFFGLLRRNIINPITFR